MFVSNFKRLPGLLPLNHTYTSPSSSTRSNSKPSDLSDLSSNFETESSFSDNFTDFEDDEPGNSFGVLDILDLISEKINVAKSNKMVDSILTRRKRTLVDVIMKDFWSIFTQEWSSNIQRCTSDSSSSSVATHQQTITASQAATFSSTKRNRLSDEDGDDESKEDDGRDPKRPRKTMSPTESPGRLTNFACPYRKHDPHKYNHGTRRWRTCALTSFDIIARLK